MARRTGKVVQRAKTRHGKADLQPERRVDTTMPNEADVHSRAASEHQAAIKRQAEAEDDRQGVDRGRNEGMA